MGWFESGFRRVLMLCGAICGLVVAWVAVSISLNVALRALSLGSIPWLHEVTEYLIYAGTMLGAPWALRLGAHVRVDILLTTLRKGLAVRLEQLLDILGLLVSAVLFWYGAVAVYDAVIDGTMQRKMLNVPEWLLLLPFAISMALFSIEFVLRFFRAREAVEREASVAEKAGF